MNPMTLGLLAGGVVALFAVALLFALLELKTSRPDGVLLRVHPYRRLMFFLMPSRNGSVVYFDELVRTEKLEAFLAGRSDGAHITHAVVAAVGLALNKAPRMNRFVAGQRLYDRKGRFVTFAMKRARLDRDAKLATVKIEMKDGEPFADLVSRINGTIGEERSGKTTRADQEFALFNALPRPFMSLTVSVFGWLQHFNLIPAWFIADDPLHTSVFIANLGSLGMGAGYHHLFEYGTCPLFLMVGRVEDAVAVVDGAPAVVRQVRLRFTYDERIDDGLNARFGIDAVREVIEDPERFFV